MARNDTARNWSQIREIPLAERQSRGFESTTIQRELRQGNATRQGLGSPPINVSAREARQQLRAVERTITRLETKGARDGGLSQDDTTRIQRLSGAANEIRVQLAVPNERGTVNLNGLVQDVLVFDAD